jgi:hypothetical protein
MNGRKPCTLDRLLIAFGLVLCKVPTIEPQPCSSKGATRRNHGEYFRRHLDPWLSIPHFRGGRPDDPEKLDGTIFSAGLESSNLTPENLPWVFASVIIASLAYHQRRNGSYDCFSYLLWLVEGFKTE